MAAMVVPRAGDSAERFADYGKQLARWVRQGLTPEPRTVCWVRHTNKADGGLGTCEHRPRKKRSAA